MQKRQAIRPLVDELGCRLPRRVISLAEIAIEQTIGKLDTREEYVLAGIRDLKLRVLPWSAVHASKLFGLPPHHRDPFDRQIIAQALAERLPLVTPDEKFRLYKGIEVIW